MFVVPSGSGVERGERSARQKQKEKRDFSLRRPTFSRERKRRKKSACSIRNDGGVGAAPTALRQGMKEHSQDWLCHQSKANLKSPGHGGAC